jgi:hypothetical protein
VRHGNEVAARRRRKWQSEFATRQSVDAGNQGLSMSSTEPANDERQQTDEPSAAKSNDAPRKLGGSERVALLMLTLGNKHATKIASMLNEKELREIQTAMASLSTVEPKAVEKLLAEFVSHMASSGAQWDS